MRTTGTMDNRRILVIDDTLAIHEDFRQILQATARDAGLQAARATLFDDGPHAPICETFEVDYADQGQAGLSMVQTALQQGRPYAVVFVDMRMPPGWDGVETLAQLWSVDPDLQAVICTAFADMAWDLLLQRLGHSHQLLILRKPFDIVEVWQMARALTQKWSLAQQAKHQLATLAATVHQRTEELRALNATLEQRVHERTAALSQEMAERQRLAQEARRLQHFALLGRLAAGVSHDIRNPLGAVFLQVDLLAEDLQAHPPENAAFVTETLAEIRLQLARLEDLVQDYLSLVRAAQIERRPQDLGAALRDWATEWQGIARAHGIACQHDGLEDLGVLAFHANTLRRALQNLIHNAFDAMPQGGALTLAGQRTATEVMVQVRDTGSGIPTAQFATIFEPLYTTKPGGTGLGLYIVQEIVAAHGGRVSVESVEGHGTTFTITLPISLPDSPVQCVGSAR